MINYCCCCKNTMCVLMLRMDRVPSTAHKNLHRSTTLPHHLSLHAITDREQKNMHASAHNTKTDKCTHINIHTTHRGQCMNRVSSRRHIRRQQMSRARGSVLHLGEHPLHPQALQRNLQASPWRAIRCLRPTTLIPLHGSYAHATQ